MGIDVEQAPFSTGYSFEVIDVLSLVGGIFLALLAGAFHIGSRLQRDAETYLMPPAESAGAAIHCRLDELLAERNMTLTELSRQVDVSIVNLSVLKNDRAKAIRHSTLAAICAVLECQVGDLLVIPNRTATEVRL